MRLAVSGCLRRSQNPLLSFLRAGDLGAVDAAYDVAASTACPALDYIVVDGTAAAQRCVELLRSRQAGVATFLILERQAHLEAAMKALAKPPEGALATPPPPRHV